MKSPASVIEHQQETDRADIDDLQTSEISVRHRKARRPHSSTANFVLYTSPTLALACLPPGTKPGFSLGAAAHISGVHPEMLLHYCRLGLLGPDHQRKGTNVTFDRDALDEVARIEHYRHHLGVQRRALHLICALRRESERLQMELRFLRP